MKEMAELVAVMRRLRGPGGCPWDREQTHQSLCVTLVEEVSELLETIDNSDYGHMEEELGDLLIQVIFHAQIAEDAGHFDLEAVARTVREKLVRRHPHVFGDAQVEDTAGVLTQWEAIKAQEAKRGPVRAGKFKHLPPRLPALAYAAKIAGQVEKGGYTHAALPDAEGVASLAEGLDEDEAGALLYQIVMACRLAGLDAESALRRHADGLVRAIEAADAEA